MKCLLQAAVFLLALCSVRAQIGLNPDPDQSRSFAELVASRGLTLQEYHVTTEDNYILTVHRVVPLDYNPANYSYIRKPVIAFHGVLCQSSIFYINSPFLTAPDSKCGDSFGFGMVLGGKYDLWVPNARGNGFSNGHLTLNSETNPDYWKFSWEQIGLYDIPAFIKLVQQQTGHKTVGYVGYSQGGASALALISQRPEYAQYLKPYIGWAPSVYLGPATTLAKAPVQLLTPALQAAPWEFVVTEQWFNDIGTAFCPSIVGPLPGALCNLALEAAMGQSVSINVTRIPVYMHFFPAPGSNWQVAHFGQQLTSGRFARYDYGLAKNLVTYGTLQPPDFPLGNIPKDTTMIIICGNTDSLVAQSSCTTLVNKLKSVGITNVINDPAVKTVWSHFDFVAGTGAGAQVYDKTIAYLDQYTVWDGPV